MKMLTNMAHFGMSNQIIFYNLQIIWLLLSIDLDT